MLTLSTDLLHVIKWYIDKSFAVHPNFKSYTGSVMTMGEGAIQGNLSKQKLNTCSSCDIELVGNDDASTKILWTQLFMEAQGYKVQQNIMYQDNKSTIQLLKNGHCSADKRSHTINIGYFFMADQHYKGLINVKYCPTSKMWADPMTKPLQSLAFKLNADRLMGRRRN